MINHNATTVNEEEVERKYDSEDEDMLLDLMKHYDSTIHTPPAPPPRISAPPVRSSARLGTPIARNRLYALHVQRQLHFDELHELCDEEKQPEGFESFEPAARKEPARIR